MKPFSVEQISDQVLVLKWNNGEESILFADKVRKKCPCATCRDEKDNPNPNPFKILKTNPNDINFISWEFVGNYALRFTFNDNHSTGIYTYDYLKEIAD